MDTKITLRRPFLPPRRSPVRARDGFAAIGGQVKGVVQLSGLVDLQKGASAAVTLATAVPGVIPVKNDVE
jgi:hypothetical protein